MEQVDQIAVGLGAAGLAFGLVSTLWVTILQRRLGRLQRAQRAVLGEHEERDLVLHAKALSDQVQQMVQGTEGTSDVTNNLAQAQPTVRVTVDRAKAAAAGLSETAQVVYLKGVIDEIDTVGKTVDGMVAEWSKGDPDGLAKLLNDDLDSNPELAKTLLADRNARWADWIAARMAKSGTVFIAVGAGHLAGKDSVQAKLAAKGLKAERVAY